jgi:hypothetical protein
MEKALYTQCEMLSIVSNVSCEERFGWKLDLQILVTDTVLF